MHYSKNTWERYHKNLQPVLLKIQCSSHLRSCPECAAILREIENEDRFIQQLRDSVQSYQSAADGTFPKHPTHHT